MHQTIDLQDHFKTALDDLFANDFGDCSSLQSHIRQRVTRLARLGSDEGVLLAL